MKAETVENETEGSKDHLSIKDEFLEAIVETSDEVSQVEELRIHTEKMKMNLIDYVASILRKYDIKLSIPAESFGSSSVSLKENCKSILLDESCIVSYRFADGTVKTRRLEDYSPSELMTLLGILMPQLKEDLKRKRKEYEQLCNRITKIGKYLRILKEKITEKISNPARSSAADEEKGKEAEE